MRPVAINRCLNANLKFYGLSAAGLIAGGGAMLLLWIGFSMPIGILGSVPAYIVGYSVGLLWHSGILTSISIMLILALTSWKNLAIAAEFNASKERISCNIGALRQNRIEFENSKILEVIGNSSEYSLVSSPSAKYIFLTPKVEVGKVIELSIIYSDDRAQELSLVVTKEAGQSIVIKQSEQDSNYTRTKPQDNNKELAEIIRFMALGKIGKYDITIIKHRLPKLAGRDVSLVFDLKYRFAGEELVGRRLRIVNNSKRPIRLHHSIFAEIFENIIAVYLAKETLQAKETGLVYLISKLQDLR